jgi:hypothetical protein
MSFNRLHYDTCESKQAIEQSVGPGTYMLDTPYNDGCSPCYESNPKIRIQQRGIRQEVQGNPELVDIESNLFRLTQPESRCPSLKYNPQNLDEPNIPEYGSRTRRCTFPTEEPRLQNPPATLRSTGWDRWDFLDRNPQDRVEIPFPWNTNYRLVAKDNHRAAIPRPLDQRPALPTPQDEQCEHLASYNTCAVPTIDRTRFFS